mmetsp:Transcript_13463/g.31876  ORF Transcript_13463/g.31876 Transcript_13463/m.31876 type:complete len:612 (+) Transcript_13463:1360-3195(+)
MGVDEPVADAREQRLVQRARLLQVVEVVRRPDELEEVKDGADAVDALDKLVHPLEAAHLKPPPLRRQLGLGVLFLDPLPLPPPPLQVELLLVVVAVRKVVLVLRLAFRLPEAVPAAIPEEQHSVQVGEVPPRFRRRPPRLTVAHTLAHRVAQKKRASAHGFGLHQDFFGGELRRPAGLGPLLLFAFLALLGGLGRSLDPHHLSDERGRLGRQPSVPDCTAPSPPRPSWKPIAWSLRRQHGPPGVPQEVAERGESGPARGVGAAEQRGQPVAETLRLGCREQVVHCGLLGLFAGLPRPGLGELEFHGQHLGLRGPGPGLLLCLRVQLPLSLALAQVGGHPGVDRLRRRRAGLGEGFPQRNVAVDGEGHLGVLALGHGGGEPGLVLLRLQPPHVDARTLAPRDPFEALEEPAALRGPPPAHLTPPVPLQQEGQVARPPLVAPDAGHCHPLAEARVVEVPAAHPLHVAQAFRVHVPGGEDPDLEGPHDLPEDGPRLGLLLRLGPVLEAPPVPDALFRVPELGDVQQVPDPLEAPHVPLVQVERVVKHLSVSPLHAELDDGLPPLPRNHVPHLGLEHHGGPVASAALPGPPDSPEPLQAPGPSAAARVVDPARPR